MGKRAGFTLIELLTVIAVIAILAAIIFPVMARAKDGAYRGSDLSNMNAIRTALQLYKVDQGGYPPALLGYATLYQTGPNMGSVVPADKIQGFLYPKRLNSFSTFKPAYNRFANADVTAAVWPRMDPRAVGQAPIRDLNGDGGLDADDDPLGARQAYGPNDGFVAPGGVTNDANLATKFYAVSGYDVSEESDGAGGKFYSLRYALFWTNWGLGSGNGMDDPRQLGYAEPPDDTVVTWNSMFRDATANLQGQKRDLVLFLGGSARTYDSAALAERSWRVLP